MEDSRAESGLSVLLFVGRLAIREVVISAVARHWNQMAEDIVKIEDAFEQAREKTSNRHTRK